MNDEDIIMLFWLFKRFALLLLVAAVIAGITYLFYDSFHSTIDEVKKVENYQTLAKDEVRYALACADPKVQQMIDDYPDDYHRFTSQMDSLLVMYQTYQPRRKKVLATLSKSRERHVKQLSKCIRKNYRNLPVDLTPFQEEGVESINEFDRLRIKLVAYDGYKSSNVVYHFMETNSGVHFTLSLGLLCTCEADSADLARYTAHVAGNE